MRTEVERISYVAELLNVDTKYEEMIISEHARKREEELEDGFDWDPNEEPVNVGDVTECSDAEIDSMFGTLGD